MLRDSQNNMSLQQVYLQWCNAIRNRPLFWGARCGSRPTFVRRSLSVCLCVLASVFWRGKRATRSEPHIFSTASSFGGRFERSNTHTQQQHYIILTALLLHFIPCLVCALRVCTLLSPHFASTHSLQTRLLAVPWRMSAPRPFEQPSALQPSHSFTLFTLNIVPWRVAVYIP
jgi:hypothetical protein